VAITLGALSAPGTPFRVFTEAPGTVAMGTLPWVGIPALLVPLYLMTLLTIAVRLRTMGGATQAATPDEFDNWRVRQVYGGMPTRRTSSEKRASESSGSQSASRLR
jgi:hypothetical protein